MPTPISISATISNSPTIGWTRERTSGTPRIFRRPTENLLRFGYGESEEEIPEDIDEPELYWMVPDKRELDLGPSWSCGSSKSTHPMSGRPCARTFSIGATPDSKTCSRDSDCWRSGTSSNSRKSRRTAPGDGERVNGEAVNLTGTGSPRGASANPTKSHSSSPSAQFENEKTSPAIADAWRSPPWAGELGRRQTSGSMLEGRFRYCRGGPGRERRLILTDVEPRERSWSERVVAFAFVVGIDCPAKRW